MGMLVLSGVDQRPGGRVSQIGGGVVVAGGHGMTRDDHQMAVESVRAGQPGLKLGECAVGQGVESLTGSTSAAGSGKGKGQITSSGGSPKAVSSVWTGPFCKLAGNRSG